MKDLSKIDWRVLQRYTNAQGLKDFDRFLDSMPVNAGYNALIAAGIAWALAGAAVLFTSMEVEKVTKIRAEMMKVESLQPPIPVLKYVPVPKAALVSLGSKIEATYSGVKVLASGDGSATLSAADTDYFPQFLAAVSTLQSGGKNWKTGISSLCVGRDCKGSKVSATIKVESVRVDIPAPVTEE